MSAVRDQTHDDPWRKLSALRAEVALVRANAVELEQLGLTLSGRDLPTVDHADLVSYVIWISQFASQTAVVLAHWGSGLVAYLEGALVAEGIEPRPPTAPPTVPSRTAPTEWSGPPAGRARRWWRRA